MKIGEIWKLINSKHESSLVGVRNGKLSPLNEPADMYVHLPCKVKIISLNGTPPDIIQAQEYPDNDVGGSLWGFAHDEFLTYYEKDWEL